MCLLVRNGVLVGKELWVMVLVVFDDRITWSFLTMKMPDHN